MEIKEKVNERIGKEFRGLMERVDKTRVFLPKDNELTNEEIAISLEIYKNKDKIRNEKDFLNYLDDEMFVGNEKKIYKFLYKQAVSVLSSFVYLREDDETKRAMNLMKKMVNKKEMIKFYQKYKKIEKYLDLLYGD